MSHPNPLNRHYEAYDQGDLEALLATLAEDYVVAPLNGAPWLNSREAARKLYTRHLADYPLALTEVLGRMQVGNVVIKREHSRPAPGSKAPEADVMPIYTLGDDVIARCDSVVADGDELAAVAVVARQLEAYNVQDLDAHVACFAEDMVLGNLNEEPNLGGRFDYRDRMASVFGEFPANRVELLGRLACGNVVCDHERVIRGPEATPFEVIAIYTVRDGLIAKVDFVR